MFGPTLQSFIRFESKFLWLCIWESFRPNANICSALGGCGDRSLTSVSCLDKERSLMCISIKLWVYMFVTLTCDSKWPWKWYFQKNSTAAATSSGAHGVSSGTKLAILAACKRTHRWAVAVTAAQQACGKCQPQMSLHILHSNVVLDSWIGLKLVRVAASTSVYFYYLRCIRFMRKQSLLLVYDWKLIANDCRDSTL